MEMDEKTLKLRKEIGKLKNMKKEVKSEVELLFDRFKQTVENSKKSTNALTRHGPERPFIRKDKELHFKI